MQPLEDASPTESIQSVPISASTIRLPKKRQVLDDPLSQSEANLPSRRPKPTAASLYASTLTPPGSRSASPAGRATPAQSFSGTTLGTTFTRSLLDTPAADNPGDPLNLILKAFVPHVAIYASSDTDDLLRDKGFDKGLWELLRPFGEQVQGKVTVRDSNGASKAWDDFSVRFVKFGENVEPSDPVHSGVKPPTVNGQGSAPGQNGAPTEDIAARINQVETVVNRHLTYAEESFLGVASPTTPTKHGLELDVNSAYYALYLRRLLSGIPIAAHETFSHPVACVIAISSRNPNPIHTFREMYQEISQGERRLPNWVDADYLRYYVLVHDEEEGEIEQSMAFFEQMKRNLGLHCHLLRIRSTRSAETDDDSIQLPRSDWMTAAEELSDIEQSELHEDFEDPTKYIFESDANAIRTFVKEMVNQSLVPTMERNISLWNDQVASKRKGIGGRLMTFSKRWAGFGSSNRNTSNTSQNSVGYDVSGGFYPADAPESIMRKLADWAFMLRDWKLAMSTYDILRSDFADAKAWRYHAAANEMAAFALLIMPTSMSSRTKIETINQMLEQGFYSYLTRCGSPYGAVRTLALGLELQRLRGGPAVDEAVKWGIRLMEARLVGSVGDALLKERMAVCCATRQGVGSLAWGSRRRKSAFWSVLAAESWLEQRSFIQAQRCLNEARKMYSMLQSDEGISGFRGASDFMAGLQKKLKKGLASSGEDGVVEEDDVDETSERRRSRPAGSLVGTGPNMTLPIRGIAAEGGGCESPKLQFE